MPLIAQWITPDEWQMFIDRGWAYVKPANLRFALAFAGFILTESTPEGADGGSSRPCRSYPDFC